MSVLLFSYIAEYDTGSTPVVVASNVVATINQSSPTVPVSLTPTVTADGTPTTSYTLTLLSPPVNGTYAVTGTSLSYTPNPGFAGIDSFTYKATVAGVDSNIATGTVTVIAACQEIGNATKIIAGAWDRVRMFGARLIRGEKRCLLVDFNGAIPAARTIVSAKWQCALPYIAFMANARILSDRRSTAVDLTANYPNVTDFKCTATLDNGEEYVQLIRVEVDDTYWFSADTIATVGPTVLVAT